MIHGYHHKPAVQIHRAANEIENAREITLGCEIEVDKCADASASEAAYSSLFPTFTHQERDGSLRSGFEVVSQPATLAYHMSGANWQSRLQTLDAQGCKSYNTTTCGLHIHIGRKAMTKKQQILLGVFINRQKDKMIVIARRESPNYAQFINLPELNSSIMGMDETQYAGRVNNARGRRYNAVNYQNRTTIELRFFKGTLKYETLLSSFQLAHAIVQYVKRTTLQTIMQEDREAAWKHFCEFVLSFSTYEMLAQYLRKKKIMTGTGTETTVEAPVFSNSVRRNRTATNRINEEVRIFIVDQVSANLHGDGSHGSIGREDRRIAAEANRKFGININNVVVYGIRRKLIAQEVAA